MERGQHYPGSRSNPPRATSPAPLENGSSTGSDATPPVLRRSMAEILGFSDEENDTADRPQRGGSPRNSAGGVSVSLSRRALSQIEEAEAGSTVAFSNAEAGAISAVTGDPPSERPLTLSVPHTASQLVFPAGALKYKKPAATETVSMAEGFQALAAQREAADANKDSARMVTSQAHKELVKDKVRLSEKTFALEERHVLQETLDKEAERAHRRGDNLKNLVLDSQRAGMSMQDYFAAREVLLTSSN